MFFKRHFCLVFQVSLKVHCLQWQDHSVYNKSIKIKAILLIISMSFVVCFFPLKVTGFFVLFWL